MIRSLMPSALAAVFALGCASAGAMRNTEIDDARAAFQRAEMNPVADRSQTALSEAQIALMDAEQAERLHPGSREARDKAYVAQRMAEKARFSSHHALEVEVLVRARESTTRLRRNVRRRAEAAEDRARRTEAERLARVPLRGALRSGLEDARKSSGQIADLPEGTLLRLPVEELFIWGTSKLGRGAEQRIAAIAEAVRSGPPCTLQLQVLDDLAGNRADGALLARRRLQRLKDSLEEHGVPTDVFVLSSRIVKPGTQVDFVISEKPVIVPLVIPPIPDEAASTVEPPRSGR